MEQRSACTMKLRDRFGYEDNHTKLYFMTRTSRAAATSCFEEQEGDVFTKTKEEVLSLK